MDIKKEFSSDCAKKIFGNSATGLDFLAKLAEAKKFGLPGRKLKIGPNAGQFRIELTSDEIWAKIVEHFDYDVALPIVREMFKKTKKYISGLESHATMSLLIEEWKVLKLGEIDWPFSGQDGFDKFVQAVNSHKLTGDEKDSKVKSAAVKYRKIKEINTVRNDYIETLIFEKNANVLPTLRHGRLVDFFIDGQSFDQKVSRSTTKEFVSKFSPDWKQHALDHPEVVAEYVYTYQNEERFGADSRLLIVFLDEDISIERIAETIENTNIENPLEVTFKYNHKIGGEKTYKVMCFVILLSA